MADVTDNPALNRFELSTGAGTAISEYRLRDGVLEIRHTEVPEELEGQGIGSRLARGVLEAARARGLKVVAKCPFIAGYIGKHAEYQGLLK